MTQVKRIFTVFIAVALMATAAPAQERIPAPLVGAWRNDAPGAKVGRLIIRRGEMILLDKSRTTHGRLIPDSGDRFRYVVNFVNNEQEGRIESVTIKRKGDKLSVTLQGSEEMTFSSMPRPKDTLAVRRKGFGYTIPAGWVSNVELRAGKIGKAAADFDTDQLVHYYETGVDKPSESLTVRLLDTPYEKMLAGIARKMANPALISHRSALAVGSRKGSVYENSTPLGTQRISAKVYILPWDGGKTLALAASTLLPTFPFDLDRVCRAILNSVE